MLTAGLKEINGGHNIIPGIKKGGLNRAVNIYLGSMMNKVIYLPFLKNLIQLRRINIQLIKFCPGVKIFFLTGAEIVHHNYLITLVQQFIHYTGANKSRSPGYHYSHYISLTYITCY